MKATANREPWLRRAALAAIAAMALALAIMPAGADAAKVDNPSPPNFRAEITGGFLEVIGTTGTALGIPMDFAEFDLPNPAFAGTVTTNANGYGVINIPNNFYPNCVPAQTPANGGICFAPIPVNIDDIAVTIRILPVAPFTGMIDPLSGIVHMNMPLRLKVEGAAMGVDLGNSCYIGNPNSSITMATKTHIGNFPTTPTAPEQPQAMADFAGDTAGWIAGEAYSDEPGVWGAEPKEVPGYPIGANPRPTADQIPLNPLTDFIPRAAGSWRGVDETLIARAAEGCGLATSVLNDQVGLPASGNNTAVVDFRFTQFPGRPNAADAIVNKAVKSRFIAPGTSSNPWPTTEKPTAVSAQEISIDASSSTFKVGGHATERYSFDFGSGNFGPWTTNPVASFIAPTIPEGGDPEDLEIRVRVKDSENDVDIATREIQVVPATDISVQTSVTSVAGDRLRGGSSGQVTFDVKNNSANDASSLALRFAATLPAGVTATGFDLPAGWDCTDTATSLDCSLPKGELGPGETDSFKVDVDVTTNAPSPAAIAAEVQMAGDPNPANNIGDRSVPVVKTDLTVSLDRVGDMIANAWHPYEIQVDNVGDGLTVGGATVQVDLPADFTFRSQGSGGDGWSCSAPANPQTVTCGRTDEIAGNASAPLIVVWARVDRSTPEQDRTVSAAVTTQGDINAFNGTDSDSDTGTVQVLTDLAMDVAIPNHLVVGDPGVVTYKVTNQSVVPTSVPTTIESTLPAGVTVSEIDGPGWDCSATEVGGDEVSCVHAAGLGDGEATGTVTLTVDVAQAAYPAVTVPATLQNSQDAFAPNDQHEATNEVRRLDVEIKKLAVRPFNVGIEGRYRLNVTNVGNSPTVGDIVVTDELPDGLTLNGAAGAGWDCSESQVGQKQVHCVLASPLGSGIQAAPIEARVTVLDEAAAVGTVVNTAYVDTERDDRSEPADDAVTANNVSTISTTAVAVDLSIESTHQGTFRVGTDDLYSLTIRNVGAFATDPGEAITVTNDLPDGILPLTDEIEITRPGWDCDEADGDVTCVLEAPDAASPAMGQGSAVTIDIPVHIVDAAADSSENVAQVSTARDSNPDLSPNNIAVDPTTVERIDLALDGNVSIAPRAGGIGQVTLGVENIGSHKTVQPTTVTVPLAAGTSYRPTGSQTTGWSCSSPGAGTQVTCVRTQSIAPGASAPTLKLRTNVSGEAAASWTTEAVVETGGEPAERLADNTIALDQELETIDLAVAKSHDPAAVTAGKRASQAISVSNVGNTASAATIRVQDKVDSAFTNVTANGPGWTCSVSGNDVDCTRIASVPAGGSTPDITVAFNIPGDQSGTKNSNARVSSSDDPFEGNDVAGDPISIVASADVAVSISQPSHVRVGNTVGITYRVRNIGTDSTSGSPSVKLKITPSDGFRPLGGTSNGAWDCEATEAAGGDPGALTCEFGDELGAGGETILTGEFEVMPTDETEVGTLAVVSTAGEINRSNNAAVAYSTLSGVDLEATVSAPGDDFLVAGSTTNRVVNVSNVGTSSTTGSIEVNVPLPAGVQWDTGVNTGSTWSCNLISGTVKCVNGNQLAPGGSLQALTLGLRPSRSNAPSVQIAYTVTTPGDENGANDSAIRTDVVRFNPDTNIASGPSSPTTARTGTVTFDSPDDGVTFECSLDGAAFEPCTSPWNLSGLTIGDHIARVRSVNEFGMPDLSPASAAWTVQALAFEGPNVPLTLKSTGGTLSLASLGSVDLPDDQVKLEGLLYTDEGGVSIPQSGVTFAPVVQTIEDVLGPGTEVSVVISITATGDGVGSLPNGGGPATLTLPVRADVEAKLGTLDLLPPGTECSLRPITFEFSGNYDEAAGTVRLAQPNVAFPQVTGCDTFKAVIDDLLELPRSDIEMDLQFAVEKGAAVCPDGQVGTPPDCSVLPQGTPKLAKPVIKAPKRVKAGKAMTVRARIRNAGEAAATNVRVCLATPRALVRGKARRCKTIKRIAPGKAAVARFKLRTKPKKGKRVRKAQLKVTASGKGLKAVTRRHVTVLR